jgi:hypothetical protein
MQCATSLTDGKEKERESHLVALSFLRRSATEKAAVVRIFIWYGTWKEAMGRLLMATNCNEFWTT